MKLIAITDIHGSIASVNALGPVLTQADLVLMAGDFTTFGSLADARAVLDALRAYNQNLLAVHGNCDPPGVAGTDVLGDHSLHGRGCERGGIAFIGQGGSLPCPGRTPNEFSEMELADLLALGYRQVDADLPLVVVAHQPPKDSVGDRIANGMHVGSRAVRDFIERHRPLLCVTGHIHESAGTGQIGDTVVMNPGPLSAGNYAVAEIRNGTLHSTEIRHI